MRPARTSNGRLVDHSVNGELFESGNLRRSIREQVKYARLDVALHRTVTSSPIVQLTPPSMTSARVAVSGTILRSKLALSHNLISCVVKSDMPTRAVLTVPAGVCERLAKTLTCTVGDVC